MSEVAIASWVAYVLLLALAAVQDLRSLRISNALSVAVLLVALGHALLMPGPAPFWHHLLSFLIVFAGGLLLFGIGWLGGGDVKLFAGAAAWFGLADLAWFVAAVLMTGALLALAMLGGRLIVGAGGDWRSMRSSRSIPYGVAIAAAAILLSARSLG